MVASLSGNCEICCGGITLLPSSEYVLSFPPLPSPTNVMCSAVGLFPVNNATRVGVQRGDAA
jgi:hypothetical protein